MNPEREVSGLGLDGLKEVVFNGRLRGGAVRGGGKAAEVHLLWCRSLLEHSPVVLSVWDLHLLAIWRFRAGSAIGGQDRGNRVEAVVVDQRSGGGGFFFSDRRTGVCYGRCALVRSNWS